MSNKDTPKPAFVPLEQAKGKTFLPREGARRSYKAQGLANLMPKVTRQVAGKRPTLITDLQAAWPEIVGPKIAQFTRPVSLAAKTLKLEVANGAGPIIALQRETILSKLGVFLGADKVARLTFIQVDFPLPEKQGQPKETQDSVRSAPEALTPTPESPSGQGKLEQAMEILRQKLEGSDKA